MKTRYRDALQRAASLVLLATAAALAGCASPAPSRAPAPPPASVDAGLVYLEEDQVDSPARPLAPIAPRYPEQLAALGIEGRVDARVGVRVDGSVGAARLLHSTHDAFTRTARDALRQARFDPARLAGQPVSAWTTVRLRFRLADSSAQPGIPGEPGS